MTLLKTPESKMAINVGSSSIKTSVFFNSLRVDVSINFIGLVNQRIKVKFHGIPGMVDKAFNLSIKDDLCKAASITIQNVSESLEHLNWPKPSVIGHRVKFAGFGKTVDDFTESIEEIMRFNDYLSSRHNTLCLEVLKQCKMAFPHAKQKLVRDQAINDLSLQKEHKIPFDHFIVKRFGLIGHGYHGLAIKASLDLLRQHDHIENFSGVICQVGSGVSFSAVENGKLIYNTMQYAACDGPIMHNRSGSLPTGMSLRFLRYGLPPSSLSNLFNRMSGIYGLAGIPSNSTTTVEDILSLPEFAEAKQSYLKANGVELFRAIAEAPSASNFIFSGGLVTKHRWLSPALLLSAKAISISTMEKMVEQLTDTSARTVEADGITLHLAEIDEQMCILKELDNSADTLTSLDFSKGICEVPGSAIGRILEGEQGWGPGKISLCFSHSKFPYVTDNLPEAFIMAGNQRSDFFLRASFARSLGIPTIFLSAHLIEHDLCLGNKIFLDTPTRTAVIL